SCRPGWGGGDGWRSRSGVKRPGAGPWKRSGAEDGSRTPAPPRNPPVSAGQTMTYEEALAYLGSLEVLGIRPGLERIRTLLHRLGEPQTSFPSVLIAGTNGKGSVAAYVASILSQAGHPPPRSPTPHHGPLGRTIR